MSEIRFYHLQRASLEDTLPVILERAYGRGDRILVMTGSSERAEALASHLWTYKPDSFLPHGTAKDGAAAEQPIYLTAEAENPNAAKLLMEFLLSPEHSKVAVEYYGLSLHESVKGAEGMKSAGEVKTIRPSIEEIAEGIPEVIEDWRDTFGS